MAGVFEGCVDQRSLVLWLQLEHTIGPWSSTGLGQVHGWLVDQHFEFIGLHRKLLQVLPLALVF